MDDPELQLQSLVDKPEESEKVSIHKAAGSAAKIIGNMGEKAKNNKDRLVKLGVPVVSALVIGGVTAGIELSHSKPEVKADVPYQQYGKGGHSKPVLEKSASRDPSIENIKFVPSNNPFEIAQQLLWLAANDDPHRDKVVMLHVQPGVMEVSGVTLYHAPVGSKHFMPFDPSNNGEAGKLVIPPGEVALIKDPVTLTTYTDTDEPKWIIVTPADNTSTKDRATDVKQVYWLSAVEAEQKGAKFLAYKGFPSNVGDASVDKEGNFQFGLMQANQPSVVISTVEIVKDSEIKKKNAELGVVSTPSTVSPPPPLVGH